MVTDTPDGRALARRLAVATGGDLSVVDERSDPEPTPDGTVAYAVAAGSRTLADVSVHPDRLHLEVRAAPGEAAAVAADADLRIRPKATRPPRTLVFVETAEEIAPALDALAAVRSAVE
jgi:hypothetical protein